MPIRDWNTIKAQLAQAHARNMAVTREHTARLRSQAVWTPFGVVKWIGQTLALLLVSIIIAFIFVDWNAMRGPVERWASFRTGREIHIDGNLDVHPWSWTPHITVNGLRIGNPDWAGKGEMATIGRVDMKVRLLPLFYGRLIFPVLDIESPSVSLVRDKQGRANWDFSGDPSASEPLKLPDINNLTVRNGKLEVIDKRRGLTFEGNVASNDAGGQAGFSLTGDGRLNGAIFNLDAHGGSLLHADPSKPYLFALKVRAGTTRVTADGSITKPFDFGHLQADMTFKGSDLANLYYLTGLALPNSPPYTIKGHLTRDAFVYRFENLAGTIGSSDLEGNLTVDATADRTLLTGAIASRKLDFDDLGALFGTRLPGAKVRRSAVAQAAAKPTTTIDAVSTTPTRANTATLVLPDAPLDVTRVRQMDARVTYQADSIKAQSALALKSMYLGITLDRGLLTLDPLTIKFRQGKMSGRVAINARQDVPVTDIDVRLAHLPLQQFFHLGSDDALEGTLAGRAKLHGTGNSVHKAASTASGTVAFVVPHGQIRQAFAELLGIDVLNGLGLMLTKDKSQSDVRCAVASFRADNGVLRASQIVFDTDVVRAHGEGSVNLRNETLDLTLKGEPKKFRLLHLGAPITVQGPLSAPSVGVQASKALGQGGIAVALGALVAPVAALIPFVDPGLAEDADCHGLLLEARRNGTPVTRAQAAQSN